MTQENKKHREFWLRGEKIYNDVSEFTVFAIPVIHVIEYQALQGLQDKIKELEAQCKFNEQVGINRGLTIERLENQIRNNGATFKVVYDKIQSLEKQKDIMRKALEIISKRPDLPNPDKDSDWKNCMKWSSHEARQALKEVEALK